MAEEEAWSANFVEVTALVHATEDLDRVVRAVQALIPEAPILLEILKGHHGNRIVRVHAYTRDCSKALRVICSRLPPNEVELVDKSLPLLLTPEGDLVLRIDKQELVLGSVRLGEGDDVVKLKFRLKRGVKSVCAEVS